MSFPRPLTDQEKEWLRRALALLPTGKHLGGGRWRDEAGRLKPLDPPVDPAPYLAQIETLEVVDRCHCGDPDCHTVYFRGWKPGGGLALVHTSAEDGRELIVFVDEADRLVELEII